MHHLTETSAADPTTVDEALRRAMALGLERLDAQLLTLHALARPSHDRTWLVTHGADLLPPDAATLLQHTTARRAAGEPLAYITGHKEFFGLDLKVDARVLVPRPDTETLVEWALELLPQGGVTAAGNAANPDASTSIPAQTPHVVERVIDLGTGSGAIALAIKHTRPDLQVLAVDRSAEALSVARANAQRLQLELQCVQTSWMVGVQGHFALIVSNPPYIAAADPHLPALRHEPLQALASGSDGLDDIRTIVQQACGHLQPGGWLLLEHGYDQAAAVRALLTSAGLQDVQSRRDLAGIERCSGGRWTNN